MYEVGLTQSWDRFGAHLEGSSQAIACIVSFSALSEQAKGALKNSVAALGYGKAACTFLALNNGAAAEPDGASAAAEPGAAQGVLREGDLFAAVEGLDPLLLIIADARAVQACADAYRLPLSVLDKGRLFGRDVITFDSFETMLADPEEKQKAWRLLKRLPRLNS